MRRPHIRFPGQRPGVPLLRRILTVKCFSLVVLCYLLFFFFTVWTTSESETFENIKKYLGCKWAMNMPTGCTWFTPRCRNCDNVDIRGEDRPCCQRHLRELMHYIIDTFERMNITYWIDRGVLLGSILQGDLNHWDNDADISILLPQGMTKDEAKRRYFLNSNGKFGKNDDGYVYDGKDIWYSPSNHNNVDMYYWTYFPHNNTVHFKDHAWNFDIPWEVIFPLQKCLFDGRKVNCPRDPIRYLKYKYPKNLLEPVYNHEKGTCGEAENYCGRDKQKDQRNIYESVRRLNREGYPSLWSLLPPEEKY